VSLDLNIPLSLLNLPSIIPDRIKFTSDIHIVNSFPTPAKQDLIPVLLESETPTTMMEHHNTFSSQRTETTISSPVDECTNQNQDSLDDDSQDFQDKSGRKLNKRTWSEEDDEMLKVLGTKYKNDWKKIMKRINNVRNIKMSPTFLRKRFMEIRDLPRIKRSKFSHEEDLKLADLIETYGMNWMKISEMFPQRGAIMLKNRYYSFIRKKNLLENLLEESKVKKPEKSEFGYETDKFSSVFDQPNSFEDCEFL